MGSTSQKVGSSFESLIKGQNKAYLKEKQADIRQTTARVAIQFRGAGGTVRGRARKGNVDFEGSAAVLNGRKLVFDAKSTKGARFPLSNIKQHQIIALKKQAEAGGAIAFLLVEFSELGRYFIAPWEWIYPLWKAWDTGIYTGNKAPASIPIEDFEKAAIEVIRQGKRLDYLEKIVTIAS